MNYSSIIPLAMATRTVCPTAITSVEMRQHDLIEELNAFYIEVTGDGLSAEYIAELRATHIDDLMTLISSKKLGFMEFVEH